MKRLAIFLILVASTLCQAPYRNVLAEEDGLQRLKEGNDRFVTGKVLRPHQSRERLKETAPKQQPFAAILTCSDSRVPMEIIFDQGIGDLFVIRVAGNAISDQVLGSLEFAVSALGVSTVIVLGHESCGAVDAALAGGSLPGHIEAVTRPIVPAISQCPRKGGLACAVEANVRYVSQKLKESKPILSKALDEGKIKVYGGVYHLQSGKVDWF